MEFTIKCPNCGEQVAHDSVYCEFCGVKIDKAPATIPETLVGAFDEPVAPVDMKAKFCSNCRKQVTLALGFCPDCGLPLVDKLPDTVATPPVRETTPMKNIVVPVVSPRTCSKCKVSYNDPELVFCPECGLRLGESERSVPPISKAYSVVMPRKEDYGVIPAGLRPPTEDDLRRK